MCAKRDRKPGFDSEFDGYTLKVKLRGEIDHHTAAVVRVNIDDLIRTRTPRTLVLDMSAVDFMDSSGLGLIMGRYSLMHSVGGEMFVLNPSQATERIMNLAGMERMVTIKRTDAALNSGTKDNREVPHRRGRHQVKGKSRAISKSTLTAENKRMTKGEN